MGKLNVIINRYPLPINIKRQFKEIEDIVRETKTMSAIKNKFVKLFEGNPGTQIGEFYGDRNKKSLFIRRGYKGKAHIIISSSWFSEPPAGLNKKHIKTI